MPAKLSGCLAQEVLQAMTSGEGMEVARKGLEAVNVVWTAPVVMASNHMPTDYVNTGGNVSRRLVTLRFDHVVASPQGGLQEAILGAELPALVNRSLRAYEALRHKVSTIGEGSFWKAVPDVVVQWQSKLAASTNKLHAFLVMDDDDRGCRITREDGCVTWKRDLEKAFESKMGCPFVHDATVMHTFGYKMSEKRDHVCKACRQLAKSRGGKCCDAYSNSNRAVQTVIHNMRLVNIQ